MAGLALLVLATATTWVGHEIVLRLTASDRPVVDRVDIYHVFVDDAPVAVTITAAWQTVPLMTTRDAIRSDVTVWRKMNFSDWDTVPSDLRAEGLDAMLGRFRYLLADPALWDRMTADDWDRVPQPMRALAYRHMAEYWSGYYNVGEEFGIDRRAMANTLGAIVMSESWFEHRAVTVNREGNRDLGLAQASDFARRRIAYLHEVGRVEVTFDEQDYFNPWKGTQFVAVWMRLLLSDMRGDLDAAVRAYHRGAAAAFDARGDRYLEDVLRRRRRYLQNREAPPAWSYLWQRDRELLGNEWPWMSPPGRK
jgi:hypothetical protein